MQEENKAKKDPRTLSHEELDKLSEKPLEELTEGEKQALAKARFYGYYDKKSMSEETWAKFRKLAEIAENAHNEREKEKHKT